MLAILIIITTRRIIMENIEDIEKRLRRMPNGNWKTSDGRIFVRKLFAIINERKLVRIENRENNNNE